MLPLVTQAVHGIFVRNSGIPTCESAIVEISIRLVSVEGLANRLIRQCYRETAHVLDHARASNMREIQIYCRCCSTYSIQIDVDIRWNNISSFPWVEEGFSSQHIVPRKTTAQGLEARGIVSREMARIENSLKLLPTKPNPYISS